MRQTIGWAASWALYYLSGYVDLARVRYKEKWLSSLYLKLLNASDDVQTWGGGDGTWAYLTSGENKRGAYPSAIHGKRNRLKPW